MRAIKVTWNDGDSLTTSINGTVDEIRRYYVGQTFNVGCGPDDKMRKAVDVEFLDVTELFDACTMDKPTYDAFCFAIKHIWRAVNKRADVLAKERAEWHDDPAADDHAEHHAPADVQFPHDTRIEAARELFNHYLSEFKLGGTV